MYQTKGCLAGGGIYHEVYKTLKEVREQSFTISHSPGVTSGCVVSKLKPKAWWVASKKKVAPCVSKLWKSLPLVPQKLSLPVASERNCTNSWSTLDVWMLLLSHELLKPQMNGKVGGLLWKVKAYSRLLPVLFSPSICHSSLPGRMVGHKESQPQRIPQSLSQNQSWISPGGAEKNYRAVAARGWQGRIPSPVQSGRGKPNMSSQSLLAIIFFICLLNECD